MEITTLLRQKPGMFTKAQYNIHIEGVKPTLEDAKKLYGKIYGMNYSNTVYRVAVEGASAKGERLSVTDIFDTAGDRSHFLAGFQLAMLLHGMDVASGIYGPHDPEHGQFSEC